MHRYERLGMFELVKRVPTFPGQRFRIYIVQFKTGMGGDHSSIIKYFTMFVRVVNSPLLDSFLSVPILPIHL